LSDLAPEFTAEYGQIAKATAGLFDFRDAFDRHLAIGHLAGHFEFGAFVLAAFLKR
jgi:hypothetical protein